MKSNNGNIKIYLQNYQQSLRVCKKTSHVEITMSLPPAELCVKCKTARLLCGKSSCPLTTRWLKSIDTKPIVRKLDEAFSPPSFFVGRVGYPEINAGPLLTPERTPSSIIDNTSQWVAKTQEEIVQMRLSLFRTKAQIDVRKPLESRIIQQSHEMLLGIKPLDVEVELEKAIIPKVLIDEGVAPHGPTAPIKRLSVNENQSALRPIEKVYYDDDLKAVEAVRIIGREKINIDTVVRIFSAGMVGRKKDRRLVPTRWAITATDDILSKENIKILKKFQELGEYRIFKSYLFGNRFAIVLIPDTWAYEMIEVWYKGAYYNPSDTNVGLQDYESYKGRKNYASNITGAYYAARLSVTEYLLSIQRQAQAVVLREIDENYKYPLGVWVIREGVKQAMFSNYEKADTLFNAFKLATKEFHLPFKYWYKKSKIVELKRKQRKITEFLA